MPLSLAELRDACARKTKMRCDGYSMPCYVHGVFEKEQEVSLGFKRGRGGYYDQAACDKVLGPWVDDEPAEEEEEEEAGAAEVVVADRTDAVTDGRGFWHDCRNQHSSPEAAMMELLDNVADERPMKCEIEVRARAGGATCVALRNDVRDRNASVLDALSLMRSDKRGPGALIGENGIGLKAAAAKLGGGAVVLSARRAQTRFVIQRGARRDVVEAGAAVFEVGVLAEGLQRAGRPPSIPIAVFAARSLAPRDVARAWAAAVAASPPATLVADTCTGIGVDVAAACAGLAGFVLDADVTPRRATHASAFEVVLYDTFEAAPTVARKLGKILRGETYLDRAFVATHAPASRRPPHETRSCGARRLVDAVGEAGEAIEPYDLVGSLLEPARTRVAVGGAKHVSVVAGFSTIAKHADAASPLLVYTRNRLVERHDDWRLALDLRRHINHQYRKEYSLGLTVVVVDADGCLRQTHTKQRIVDDVAFALAKEGAATFAKKYFVAVHKRTCPGTASARWLGFFSRLLSAQGPARKNIGWRWASPSSKRSMPQARARRGSRAPSSRCGPRIS